MRKVSLAVVMAMLVASSTFAQNTDIEVLSGLQFTFGNPGARAMGMGGAFLGLADDASAAEANPAGLTILRTPEVSIEGRNYETIQPAGVGGVFPKIPREDFNAFSRRAEVAFGSIVYPGSNWAVAAYYHQPINYQNGFFVLDAPDFYLTRGTPAGTGGPVSPAQCFEIQRQTGDPRSCVGYSLLPYGTAVDIRLQTMGLAGAWKMGNFSVGAAVRYHDFHEEAITLRTDDFGNIQQIVLQGELEDLDAEELIFKSQDDVTFSAGFKYDATSNFSIGGVYKQGAEFPAPVFSVFVGSGQEFSRVSDANFHLPDVAGLGVALRVAPTLTITADAVHVSYSNLVDDVQPVNPVIAVLDDPYEAKDVTEYHIGAEYFFATRIPFAIRAGWWREPGHSIEYVGPTTCDDARFSVDDRPLCAAIRFGQSILFPKAEDQDHMSIGVGLAWPKFQIDAAYDTSDRFKVGSLSAVFRF